jgi:Uncharacterized conserved protein
MTATPTSIDALDFAKSGDRAIVMTRSFDAPRGLVFDCHVRPDLLRRWLNGPDGWTMTVCDVDLSEGGPYRFEWEGPNGARMGMSGVHRDIAAPERVSNTQRFDHDPTGGEVRGTLGLAERDGRTFLTNTVTYPSPEARDAAVGFGMEQGVTASYNRLAALLASLQAD